MAGCYKECEWCPFSDPECAKVEYESGQKEYSLKRGNWQVPGRIERINMLFLTCDGHMIYCNLGFKWALGGVLLYPEYGGL